MFSVLWKVFLKSDKIILMMFGFLAENLDEGIYLHGNKGSNKTWH